MNSLSRKILIIGGSGFLSGTLARLARDRGDEVWVVTRGQKPLPEGVIVLRADRKDPAAFKSVVTAAGVSWDLVVDCIAFEVDDVRQDLEIFPMLAKHLVLISTDFVFDPAKRCFPQPADNPATLVDETYGGKKRRCELAFIAADTGDMRWTVFRSCHMYGPGSELGCLPEALRVPGLLQMMREGKPIRLIGGGHFLQQPIFAPDLAALILSVPGNARTNRQIYCSAGPDVVESIDYYQMIADELKVELKVEEVSVSESLKSHPEWRALPVPPIL